MQRETSIRKQRIAYLQKAPSGHADSCIRALAATGRAEIFATVPATLPDSPFEETPRPWIDHAYSIADLKRDDGLLDALAEFEPDLLLVIGWEQPAYRRIARAMRGRALRIVCMDQQYQATLKQRLGIAGSSVYLRPYFDGAFVAGARQRKFALKLGFRPERITEGFYSCDVDSFGSVQALDADEQNRRRAFIYVGRLSAEKGLDTLAAAYDRYRQEHDDPWDLLIVGKGTMASTLKVRPGIELTGFTQPNQLPDRFALASCLVLPSAFEPWGVVVHEAAAAGLGLICTEAVGAADAFVEDGINGRIVPATDVDALARSMSWFHELSPDALKRASMNSRRLSETLTPDAWAASVLSMVD